MQELGSLDYFKQNENIKKSIESGLRDQFPIEGSRNILKLNDVWVTDEGREYGSIADQREIKLDKKSWTIPAYADVSLIDKASGKVLDRSKKVKIADIPKLTNRFSVIVDGNEYQTTNQFRLKTGIYTRVKNNGDIESQFNLDPGFNFKMNLDPSSLVFILNAGNRKYHVFNILRYLFQIPETEIKAAWGKKIFDANVSSSSGKEQTEIMDLYSKVSKEKVSYEAAKAALLSYFERTGVDPETTKITIGESHKNVNGNTLLATSKKLLSVMRGDKDPDERDSLVFKELYTVDDLLNQFFLKRGKELQRGLGYRLDSKEKVRDIISSQTFGAPIKDFFTRSDLVSPPPQTNPVNIVDEWRKTTIMGTGGVSSQHAITMDVRNVHPSTYGFLDPVNTPECFVADYKVLTFTGWKKIQDLELSDKLACLIDGRLEYQYPIKLNVERYKGKLYVGKNAPIEYAVTPNHRMYVRPEPCKVKNYLPNWRFETAEEFNGKKRQFKISSKPYLGDVSFTNVYIGDKAYPIGLFCEFLGWYLSEGTYKKSPTVHSETGYANISQCPIASPKNFQKISNLLNKLGVSWSVYDSTFNIREKHLGAYVKNLGNTYSKYIPEEFFKAPVWARKKLLHTLMLGDGRYGNSNHGYKQAVYTTTSEQLANDVERLILSLGKTCSHKVYKDSREERYFDVHEIRVIQRTVAEFNPKHAYQEIIDYDGMVYGPTVPGGLILVKSETSRPYWSGNSGKVGVTLGLAVGADKYSNGLATQVIDLQGKLLNLTPSEFQNAYIGFADEYELINKKPKAKRTKIRGIYKGKTDVYDASKIKYYLPYGSSMFTISTNMIPFLAHNQGNRAMMGSRMMGQAISIEGREAPNVRVKLQEDISGTQTFEDIIGNYLNPRAGEDGIVSKVTDDYIYVKRKKDNKTEKHGLYKNFPLNQESFLQSTPLVKPGDVVKPNQLLAENNFNKDGHLALGKNVNVAYMPWKGYNFEDAAVVTESFAKEFSHESIQKKSKLMQDGGVSKLSKFRAYFPQMIDVDNASILDEDGIVKKGSTVKPGQIVIAYMQEKDPSKDELALKNLNRTIATPYKPSPVTWDYDYDGEVIEVRRTGKLVTVYIKVKQPLIVGDKIAGKHGNKSIVSKIIPDHEAPHTKDGKRIDLMLNPHGVPGRINAGQILETAAGKLVQTTGKPYVVTNFDGTDHIDKLKKEYQKNGLEFDEELLDGKDGKPFKNKVFTGNQYIMKLKHTVEHKMKARSAGAGGGGYDYNEQPSRGETGGQSLDAMQMYALLAHGAKKNLYEMTAIKGQKNDEFWRALQLGLPLPKPNSNFAFEKMTHLLKGAGVNVEKDGDNFKLLPLTDKDVSSMSAGALNPETAGMMIRGKDLKPISGGLFDEKLTGGHNGTKWTHIDLPFAIPNPVFEDAVTKVLGLTSTQFNEKISSDNGAIELRAMLSSIDVDKELNATKEALKSAPESRVNVLNKKYRYLYALKEANMRPEDAYMMSKIPIIPPKFRPIYPLPSGDLMTSPVNKHYKDVALVVDGLNKETKLKHVKGVADGTSALYNSVKAMQGFIDPITYTKEKYEGVIQTLAGSQPKEGFVQNRLWAKKQDVSGRSTITLEPSLGIDQVGLPDELAKTMYKPFIIKKLVEMGSPASQAIKEYKDWTPRAERALEIVMEERPVLLNRAPTLHKHGVQAFYPVKTTGKSIKLNPLIVSGFNADFDGDTMSVHLPVLPDAVEEAKNLVPSKIIFKSGDNAIVPEIAMEYMLGLYYLTKDGNITGKTFNSAKEATKAGLSDQDIFNHPKFGKTSVGKILFNEMIPEKLRNYEIVLDKSKLNKILTEIAKKYPDDFADTINSLRDIGNKYSHEWGASISITDFDIDRSYRDKVVKETATKLKGVTDPAVKAKAWGEAKDKIKEQFYSDLRKKNNRVQDMLDSGSAKKHEQATQLMMFPGLFEDVKGNILPQPFVKSYAEGFNTFDYWNAMYGVRKGAINTAVNTQATGALNKELLGVTKGLVITEEDCNTTKGIDVNVNEKDVTDRYLAKAYPGVGNRDTIVDNNVVTKAKEQKLTTLYVRSPLTCASLNGICVKCYGLLPNGELPEIGDNVGIADSQAVTERATQLTLQTRHTGGAAGAQGAPAASFPRLRELMDMPKTIPFQATVSKDTGKVQNVIKAPAGGYEVYINTGPGDNKKYLIRPGLAPKVNRGDTVNAGDILSTGNARPQDIAEAKGHLNAQKFIVDEMNNIYGDNYFKKTFETVVRGISNKAVITFAPDDSEFVKGDIATVQYLDDLNNKRIAKGLKPIKYEHKYVSITQAPNLEDDWLSRLTTRYLKTTIKDGAARGMSSNIHSKDPMPGYLYGEEFGQKGDFY